MTVNTLGGENSLGPDEFLARTLHRRMALYGSEDTVLVVLLIVESLTTSEVNVSSVAICKWYEVAPATRLQTKVVDEGTRVAESSGDISNGAGGVCVVVNRNVEEYGPLPPEFFPRTRQ
jgi:hypothetical protein